MANEKRVRRNFQSGTITDNPLTDSATTINSAAFADLPVIGTTQHLAITLDPNGVDGDPEIVYVTAHTTSATSATVVRGQEGTTARQHNNATSWQHAPTRFDYFTFFSDEVSLTNETTSGTTFEQWGTETVSVALASIPGKYVKVTALVTGQAKDFSGSSADQADVQVEISLDGGSTWTGGSVITAKGITTAWEATTRFPISARHVRTGEATGAVQARAMARTTTQAGRPQFENGRLQVMITPYLDV